MAQTAQARHTEAEEFTTFEDIFALALANTKSSRFKGDSDVWNAVLYEVCQDYRDKMPELEMIFFEERPPLPPQSSEFYQLITTLSMSNLITLPNPNYAFIMMDERQKTRARELEERRLEKYKDDIEKITKLLDEQLAAIE